MISVETGNLNLYLSAVRHDIVHIHRFINKPVIIVNTKIIQQFNIFLLKVFVAMMNNLPVIVVNYFNNFQFII